MLNEDDTIPDYAYSLKDNGSSSFSQLTSSLHISFASSITITYCINHTHTKKKKKKKKGGREDKSKRLLPVRGTQSIKSLKLQITLKFVP